MLRCFYLMLALIIYNGLLLAQSYNLFVDGKSYVLTGDNLTIVIGDNPIVKTSNAVPEAIVKNIQKKYESRIAALDQQYRSGKILLNALNDSIKSQEELKNAALSRAATLAKTFSEVDFSQQSYIYRLAYVVYNHFGDVEAALFLLNDETLGELEYSQALKYLLLIDSYLKLDTSNSAIDSLFRIVSYRYPYDFVNIRYADYLLKTERFAEAKEIYKKELEKTEAYSQVTFDLVVNLMLCESGQRNYKNAKVYGIRSLKILQNNIELRDDRGIEVFNAFRSIFAILKLFQN